MPPHVTVVVQQSQPGWLIALQILGFAVQVGSLIFLAIYVMKTIDIAEANRRSAAASEKSLLEMQATREAESAPYVVFYLDARGFLLHLVVENLGKTAAKNVTLSFSPELPSELAAGNTLPSFVTGVPLMLAPRQRMDRVLNSFPNLLNNALPHRYDVTVAYDSAVTGKHFTEVFALDIDSFRGVSVAEDKLVKAVGDGFNATASAMSRVQKQIEDLDEHLGTGLNVISRPMFPTPQSQIEHADDFFKALVKDLASTWRIWQSRDQQDRSLSVRLIIERLQQGASALSSVTPLLDIEEVQADRIRDLAYDLEAAAKWLMFQSDPSSEISAALEELSSISNSLTSRLSPRFDADYTETTDGKASEDGGEGIDM